LTSPAEEKDVLSVYPSAKTFVIPNGVNEELFSLSDKPKDKSFYNKFTGFDCTDKKIIISMGRLDKVKGFNILIESIGMIAKLVPNLPDGKAGLLRDLVLFIAGEDFGEKKNLEILIDKLALKEKVFLIGRIDGLDKIKFLRNADVFALASHHENFGMVIAEALAAGTPVIASRNTPWQDVEKQNCGKWIENTPEKFAEAINEILNGDTLQMGKNGSQYISENFDWESISIQFKGFVKTIL
jgi:glycosyltransferase involved in cell wall biosynthesis